MIVRHQKRIDGYGVNERKSVSFPIAQKEKLIIVNNRYERPSRTGKFNRREVQGVVSFTLIAERGGETGSIQLKGCISRISMN